MNTEFYKELYELMKVAFIDMNNLVNRSKDEKKYIFSHYHLPKLSGVKQNGMPNVTEFYGIDGPRDYKSLFTSNDDEKHYNYNKIDALNNVLKFFETNISKLKEFTYFKDIDQYSDYGTSYIRFKILCAFDNYRHLADSETFDEDVFNDVMYLFFNRIFMDDLPISICVPILMVGFKEDEIAVTDHIRIRKLSDTELLSIYKIGNYSDTYELFLITNATHVLELKNYSVPNVPMFSWFALDHKEAYPLEIIDKWFAALRIVTNIESGYGQILAFPNEWGIGKEKLLEIHGDKIFCFNYKYVTDKLWNNSIPVLKDDELKDVNNLFELLLNNTNNAINIAIKRLNRAYLRENEEDAIIDLVIGIEALVTNNDHGEITYKVSTRAAFVLSTLQKYPYTIMETKNAISKLYAFRSKVVHGAAKIEKSRVIKICEDISKDSVPLAIELLKYLIYAIASNAEFSSAAKIDAYFLEYYQSLINSQE